MFKQLMSGRKDTPYIKQMTLFIPRADQDLIESIRIFLKLKFPKKTLNWFVLMCIKHTLNTALNPSMRKLFKEIHFEMGQVEMPSAPDFIQQIRGAVNAKTTENSDS